MVVGVEEGGRLNCPRRQLRNLVPHLPRRRAGMGMVLLVAMANLVRLVTAISVVGPHL